MIFLTVGTQFPFDRLVRAVDSAIEKGLVSDVLFGQIGETSYEPRNFEFVDYLDKKTFDSQMQKASSVISHAGMGTVAMALDRGIPMLVMPRLRRYGEVVNDHQLSITRNFERCGYLLAAYEVEQLSVQINALKTFVPRRRQAQTEEVVKRISRFVNGLCESRSTGELAQ
jgi:beta-1,4-N-acetylglucosaminyltransferase